MPYVHIRVTREAVTREQKATLIAGVTDLLVKTLGKNPAAIHVVIEEVDLDNWGVSGLSVAELRRQQND